MSNPKTGAGDPMSIRDRLFVTRLTLSVLAWAAVLGGLWLIVN